MTIEYRFTAHPGTSTRADRTVYDAVPAISRVRVERMTGDGFADDVYADLAQAEVALVASATAALRGGAPWGAAVVTIEWPDGGWHKTPVPIDRETLARDRYVGVIRSHLMRQCKLTLGYHEDPVVRAWAAEVRARLAADRSDPATREQDSRWQASLAFLPSPDAVVPVSEVRIAVGDQPLVDDETAPGAVAYPTIAAAADALARIVTGRSKSAVVSMWVTWADGMRFSVWETVASLRTAHLPSYFRTQITNRAEFFLSPAHAEQNARSLPRRPLEPQRAWARELLRRMTAEPVASMAVGVAGARGRGRRGRK